MYIYIYIYKRSSPRWRGAPSRCTEVLHTITIHLLYSIIVYYTIIYIILHDSTILHNIWSIVLSYYMIVLYSIYYEV